jgi:hypothetical protein
MIIKVLRPYRGLISGAGTGSFHLLGTTTGGAVGVNGFSGAYLRGEAEDAAVLRFKASQATNSS